MSRILLVSGTPGTGKTTLAKAVAKALSVEYLDFHDILVKHKLYDSYDRKSKCYDISPRTIDKILYILIGEAKRQKRGIVIDSHLSHNAKRCDLCIVTTCDLKVLEKRLKKRRYSKDKISENMEAEAFCVCKVEALEKKHRVLSIDTTKATAKTRWATAVKKALASKKRYVEFPVLS